ncbi:MAG: hypothetical protein D6788_05675, partial [Planctomycetota bacterium]
LKYADAKKTHTLMTKLMRDYISRLGPAARDMEAFSVEVDEDANALIVLGSPAVFGFLEENLARVDNPANARSPEGYMMVSLEGVDVRELAQNINRTWASKKKGGGEVEVHAEANRSLNMLIVRGPQDQLDEINKNFIEPLKAKIPPPMKTETITLQYAQPEAVAEPINRIFEDKKRAYQSMGRDAAVSPLEFSVAVTPDVNTGQLIVQATEENLKLIKARVAELDRKDVAVGTATTIKIYPIKYADPNAVVNIINQWARTRSQSAGRQRSVAARDVISAVVEPATQSVVVTASEANHLIIADLIAGLDDETKATGRRKRHVFTLQHASAAEVANQFSQLFRQGARLRRGDPGPTFIPDPKSNIVVANVNDQELKDIEELLKVIDQEPPLEATRTTEVYPLKYADPGALNGVVLNMFRWDRRSQPSPSEQVTSAVEWATQSLVVTASPKNHAIIKKLIEKVDVESTMVKETHVYKVQHADAEELARALQGVYRGRRSTRRGDQPVQITPDPATNTLLITANKLEMDELNHLIESLDVEPDLERGRQIKRIPLEYADPYAVREAIAQLFRGRGRGPNDQVTVVADGGSRSVVVSASAVNLKRIEDLIAQLDTEEGGEREVHVVQLRNADPASVARTLNELFVRSVPRRGNQAPPITISALQGSKAVLVKAGAGDFADIAETIKALDREETMLGEEVRVVTLEYADATEVHKAMQEYLRKPSGRGGRGADLAGDMRLSVLGQSNAIVVSGDKESVERIATLIRQLDQEGEEGSVPQILVLKHADVSQIVPTLEEMFADAPRGRGRRNKQPPVFSSNEAMNAIIVRADRTDLAAIRGIVEQLDTEEAAAGETFRVIPVASGVNVTDLAEKVEESVNNGARAAASRGGGRRGRRGGNVPSITITPDTRTSSLIVSGDASLFDQAEALATKLVEMGPSGKAIRIISLGNAPAEEVERLIATLKGEGSASSRRRPRARRGGSRRRPAARRPATRRPRRPRSRRP